jgi:hypothetical protein
VDITKSNVRKDIRKYIWKNRLTEDDRKKISDASQPIPVLKAFVSKHLSNIPDDELKDLQKLFTYTVFILNDNRVPTNDDLIRLQNKMSTGKLTTDSEAEAPTEESAPVAPQPPAQATAKVTTTEKQDTQGAGKKRPEPVLKKPGDITKLVPKEPKEENAPEIKKRPNIDAVLKRVQEQERIRAEGEAKKYDFLGSADTPRDELAATATAEDAMPVTPPEHVNPFADNMFDSTSADSRTATAIPVDDEEALD